MARDTQYWADRRQELLDQLEQDEARLNKRLTEIYRAEAAKLEREIASYYQKYGLKETVEYRQLLQVLSEEDFLLLMQKMNEFAKKYPQYEHLMPIRESIYKLDRLEGLQYSIWLQQLEIGAIEQQEFDAHLELQAQRAANLAADQMGLGTNFYAINSAIVRAAVGVKWSQGKNYSDRIWDNKAKLATYLSDDIAKGFARGLRYRDMAQMIVERFAGVSLRDAMRLVYTEGTFVFNEAQAQVHEQEYEFYCISTITDSKTCEVCKGVESVQKVEPMKFSERQPGANFPPIHPRCRCTYLVVVPNEDEWLEAFVERHKGEYENEGVVF